MKLKVLLVLSITLLWAATAMAADPKLDGAYRFVGLKFQGGGQTDAEAKGMIVVHGKHMAFVKASVGRATWEQSEPEGERAKKIVAAYQGINSSRRRAPDRWERPQSGSTSSTAKH